VLRGSFDVHRVNRDLR